jgi:hypothetical protein
MTHPASMIQDFREIPTAPQTRAQRGFVHAAELRPEQVRQRSVRRQTPQSGLDRVRQEYARLSRALENVLVLMEQGYFRHIIATDSAILRLESNSWPNSVRRGQPSLQPLLSQNGFHDNGLSRSRPTSTQWETGTALVRGTHTTANRQAPPAIATETGSRELRIEPSNPSRTPERPQRVRFQTAPSEVYAYRGGNQDAQWSHAAYPEDATREEWTFRRTLLEYWWQGALEGLSRAVTQLVRLLALREQVLEERERLERLGYEAQLEQNIESHYNRRPRRVEQLDNHAESQALQAAQPAQRFPISILPETATTPQTEPRHATTTSSDHSQPASRHIVVIDLSALPEGGPGRWSPVRHTHPEQWRLAIHEAMYAIFVTVVGTLEALDESDEEYLRGRWQDDVRDDVPE